MIPIMASKVHVDNAVNERRIRPIYGKSNADIKGGILNINLGLILRSISMFSTHTYR